MTSLQVNGRPYAFLDKVRAVSLFLLFIGIHFCAAQAPPWAWAKEAYTLNNEFALDVCTDPASGNTVVVGVFNGDISTFYGPAFVGANGGGFVAKYDPSGNVLWAFPIGNNQDDACNGVTVDAVGDIYVTGYLENLADFRGTLASPSTILNSAGGRDMFIAKYNPAGQLLWAQRGGGVTEDEGKSVAVNSNRVFVTGYFTGNATFGIFSTVNGSSSENVFLAAYDAATGTSLWGTECISSQSAFGNDISCDNSRIYLTGNFKGSSLSVYNASGGLATSMTNPVPGQEDAFMLAYDVSGNYNWSVHASGNNRELGYTNAESGSLVYFCGSADNTFTFTNYCCNPVVTSGTGTDFFVACIRKSTGTVLWVKTEPGSGNEEALSCVANSQGKVFTTGYFTSAISFTSGPVITSTGTEDVFVAVYDSLGILQWVKQAGAPGKDIGSGITLYSTGEVYVTGRYENSAAFGADTLFDAGLLNIFLAQLACTPLANNTISAAQTICAGQTPAQLIGSSPTGGNPPYLFLWEESSDNMTWFPAPGTNNQQHYSPPTLFTNMYYRRVVDQSPGCTGSSTSTSVLVTVDPLPSAANAGPDQIICSSSSAFSGNTPSSGNGTWLLVSGSGTITTPSSPTSGITSLGTGINIFEWVISSGVCAPSRDTVQITVDPVPTQANAGPDQTICSTSTLFSGNNPSSGNGAWALVSGTGTIVSPSNPLSAVNGLGPGPNIFTWSISSGTCPISVDTITITVDMPPTAANAGPDQNICATFTSFAGNTPLTGTGMWMLVSGSGTITSPSSPTSGVTSLGVGVNIFQWVISNGVCAPSRDTVRITVDPYPTLAYAGPDQVICSSATTFAGNVPVTGSGVWTLVSGTGTIVTPTSPTSAVNGLSVGQNVFAWSITSGVCPPSRDTVIITRDPQPTPSNAGPDQTICASSTVFAANTPLVGNGNWSLVAGSGTVFSFNSPTSSVSGLGPGQNVFVWTISNGVCPPSTDTVIINVDPLPSTANAGPDQTICSSSSAFAANAPVTGTGAWSLIAGSGTIVAANSPTSAVNGLSLGQNIFVWTISNGVCPPSRDTIIISVDAYPTTANAGPNQTLCSGASVFAANAPVVGTGAWSLIAGSGTISSFNSPSSPVTSLGIGQNIFVWTISNGTCPPSSDTVIITVDAMPTASAAGPDQTICSPSSVFAGNVPVTGSGTWTLIAGTGTIVSPTQPNSGVTGLSVGQNIFVWTISNGTCPSSRDTVIITRDPLPTTANAGPDQTICSFSSVFSANTPVTGTGNWTLIAGSGTISSFNSPASAVNGLSIGQNMFTWTITSGTCPPSIDTIVINVDQVPTNAYAGQDQFICGSASQFAANTPGIGTGTWSLIQGTGTILSPNSPSTAVNGLSVGQNVFVWTIVNGSCPPSRDTVIITRDPLPTASNAGPDQTICTNSSAFAANTPLTGTGNWTLIAGTGSVVSFNSPSSAVTGLSVGQNIFVWTITSGTCPPSADTVIITVVANPSAANAGSDQGVCGGLTTLAANIPSVGTGTWTVVSGTGNFSNPNIYNTAVTGLSTGNNTFRWTITNNSCPSSWDEVDVVSYDPPSGADAGSDQMVILSSATLSGNLPSTGAGNWSVVSGGGVFANSSDPGTIVSGLLPGDNILRWTISNGVCADSTDEVVISVKELMVPNAFSPDGDGFNDHFEIKGLLEFDQVLLEVFNRWGNQVYKNSDYKNDWDGRNQSGVSLGDDTYYYILKVDALRSYNGYIILKRK